MDIAVEVPQVVKNTGLALKPTFFQHTVSIEHLYDCLPSSHLPSVGKEGRVLPLSNPKDVVQLSSLLTSPFFWINDHFERAGLAVAKEVIFSEDLLEIPVHNRLANLDVFCWGRENGGEIFLVEYVKALNDKNYFTDLCAKKGWPVPKTLSFKDVTELQNWKPSTDEYPVVVKAAVSGGGKEVWVCHNVDDFDVAVDKLNGRRFQVQEFLPDASFYSVQYRSTEGEPFVKVTQQIIQGNSYAGTSTKVSPEGVRLVMDLVQPCLDYISSLGIKIFGIDFAYTADGQVLFLECNPRYGASMYPAAVAQRLGHQDWEYRYLHPGLVDLSQVLPEGREYCPKKKAGAVIVDWGSILRGEVGILFLGLEEQRMSMISEVEEHISNL